MPGEHQYVFLDGIWLKRSWGGEVENVAEFWIEQPQFCKW